MGAVNYYTILCSNLCPHYKLWLLKSVYIVKPLLFIIGKPEPTMCPTAGNIIF